MRLLALLVALLTALALTGSALATDRYVNSGASCPGSGTQASPYCSFSSINSLDLAPGDRILLARGATFNVSTGPSLILGDEDDGSAVAWNSVEPYGSGARPIITGANVADTIGILGQGAGGGLDYWKFADIELKNASKGFQIGYATLGHQGLRFEKLYIHDMIDSGPWSGRNMDIQVTATNPPVPGPGQWVLKDVQVTDNEFSYLYGGSIDAINSLKLEAIQDILFMRNYAHDLRGGFGFRYTTNVKWISNRDERVESGSTPAGNTDLHMWAMHDTTFVNSIFDYAYDTSTNDQTFFDIAYRIDQFRMRNNLIEDAAGPGIEWHVWRAADDYGFDPTANYYTNQEISGNSWRNNGWTTTPSLPSIFEGSMSLNHGAVGNCSTPPTGTVSENLYWEPAVFFNSNGCASPSLSVTNNTSVAASADISYAAQVFSDAGCSTSPWSYESSTNGSSWTAMTTLQTVNPGTDVRCKPSAASVPWVSRFEAFPNTGSSFTVARTWTAPSTGTVSIRSRALKAELGGDGVLVRIRKNATTDLVAQLTLGANDQVGVVLNVDSVPVVAGDKIRFEVDDIANSTSDRISWSPVVAYRPSNGNLALSATTSASSTDTANGYCVCRINDGNTADFTGWASADTIMPEWVQMDWASSQTVSRIEFYTTGSGYETRDFQVQYWDGSGWVTPSGWSVTGNSQKHRTFTVTQAISTTKIRVYITLGDSGGFARIDELEVYAANPNLATSATTSASSTDPSYCACRVNDLQTTDYNGWTSGTATMPQWVQLTWGSSQRVSRVEFDTTGANPTRDFQIQYWTGSAWVTPPGASITGNTAKHRTVSFPVVSTTQLRVYVTLGDAATGYARVDELAVYSDAGSNPNVGPSASATSASSTDTAGGYCACRINDGITTAFNGWASGDNVMPEWVQMDWTSSQTVASVVLYTTPGFVVRDFQIQYWNGSSWVTPSGASITGNTQEVRTVSFTAVSTTKLRVNVTLGDAVTGYARVEELGVYATANPNLGPSASATSASSTDTANGYCACKINDGNIANFTGWASADTTMPEWVQMDWASQQTVGRVEFYTTGSGYETRNFQIQYWNGVSWLTPPNGSIINNTAKHRTAIFPAVAMTKLRVYVTLGDALGGFARVDELEAYLS